eukprot:15204498-Alexandrium_andersonii.AAC.1
MHCLPSARHMQPVGSRWRRCRQFVPRKCLEAPRGEFKQLQAASSAITQHWPLGDEGQTYNIEVWNDRGPDRISDRSDQGRARAEPLARRCPHRAQLLCY